MTKTMIKTMIKSGSKAAGKNPRQKASGLSGNKRPWPVHRSACGLPHAD